MTTTSTSAAAPSRMQFVRSGRDRVIRGVAGGLGARTGVDPVLLRIFFVVLTLAGGAGVLLYGIGVVASVEPEPGTEPTRRPLDLQQAGAVTLVALGLLLFLRSIGLWFGDELVWPAVLAGLASGVIWTRGSTQPTMLEVPSDPLGLSGPRGQVAGRLVVGLTLAVASGIAFLTTSANPLEVLAPLVGIVVGGVLVLAPWLLRLWEQVTSERTERARADARSEVAAHLHDSVLQTLALIQRSDDPRAMTGLARRQERELRAWLYGGRDLRGGADRVAGAVDDLVTDVESSVALQVDAVVVGDAPVDAHVAALLSALREALVNVSRHAGVDAASLYVEVEPDRVTAFVRDRGVGFDQDAVDPDRHGLRSSIIGRLERHRGGATVRSAPGDGTEVEAWVPRGRDTAAGQDAPETATEETDT